MRVLFFALSCIASLATAQLNPPQCGVNTVIAAVSSSGCGLTNAECLCKNTKAIDDVKRELPKKCSTADLDTYALFFNTQCADQPGFPLNFTQIALESNDAAANRARLGLWVVPLAAAGAALL